MKRFILKLCIFLSLLVISDMMLGFIYKLFDYIKGGELYELHVLMSSKSPEILVLGSSRASHHYVSSIMTDSLHLSTYNGGIDGQGVPVAYGILKGVNQRVMPKIIVFEISPKFDIYEGHAPALDYFYPYLYVDGIKTLVNSFDVLESIKLKSNAYRFNSKLLRLIPNIVLDRKNPSNFYGYEPLYMTLDPGSLKPDKFQGMGVRKVSPVKEKWLRALIEEADAAGCKIIFAISPIYGGRDIHEYDDEISIIQEYGKPVLNYLNDERFINDASYFQDKTHMNNSGAIEYTKCVVKDLKCIFVDI